MGAQDLHSRHLWADFLRVWGTIVVISVHIAAVVVHMFDSVDRSSWWTANVVDSMGRWPVSIFLMLSGMLLLGSAKTESLKSFYKKRMVKAVLPFLVWSFIYSIWKIKSGIVHGDFSYSVRDFLHDLVTDDIYYHLWFFYVLIGLYLITPLLRVCLKKASSRSLKSIVVLWLVATPLCSLALRFLDIDIAFGLQLAAGFAAYMGYFVMGHFLTITPLGPRWRLAFYVLGALGLLVSMFGTYVLTERNDGVQDEYFYGSLTGNVIALSLAVFVASKYTKWPDRLVSRVRDSSGFLLKLSGASLGVYLIHPMILEGLGRLNIDATLVHPAVGIPVTLGITVIVSFAAVLLMQKVPLIRRLVP